MSEELQQPAAAEGATVMPSAEDIAAQTAAMLQQAQPKPAPTEAELREYMREFDPSDDFTEAFRTAIVSEEATAEDRKKAFMGLRDGLIGQATRGAEILIEEKLRPVMDQLQPVGNFVAKQQAEAVWDEFQGQYPDLAEYRELVDAVSSNLQSTGYKPPTKDELFKKVAEGTAGLLQKQNPGFRLNGGQPATPQQQPAAMPSMAGTSVGGPAGNPSPKTQVGEGTVTDVWD